MSYDMINKKRWKTNVAVVFRLQVYGGHMCVGTQIAPKK